MKNLHEIAYENVSKALQKHLGLDFFTETIFLTNFERFLNTRRVEPICFALLPLFIGEKSEAVAAQLELGCFHQKAPPSFGTLRKVQVGLVIIYTPLFTKYTPWCFFIDFFPKRCGTLRITQRHLFSFWNVAKFYGLRNNAHFSFRNVAKLYGLRNDACFEGSEGRKQGSRTDRKYSETKLGYDTGHVSNPHSRYN